MMNNSSTSTSPPVPSEVIIKKTTNDGEDQILDKSKRQLSLKNEELDAEKDCQIEQLKSSTTLADDVDALKVKKAGEEDQESTATKAAVVAEEEESGRERLKRHRAEMAGRVWIPDIWGQENFLKDWIDCNTFDASLVNSSIISARAALMQQPTAPPTSSHVVSIDNSHPSRHASRREGWSADQRLSVTCYQVDDHDNL